MNARAEVFAALLRARLLEGGEVEIAVVDATNTYEQMSPKLILAQLDRGSSEIIAEPARGARVVKALNSITMAHFAAGPTRATRALLVSSDDAEAKRVMAAASSRRASRSPRAATFSSLGTRWRTRVRPKPLERMLNA